MPTLSNPKRSLSCCGKVHNMSVAWLAFSQSTKLSSHREANYTVSSDRNPSAAGAAPSQVLSMKTCLLFHSASALCSELNQTHTQSSKKTQFHFGKENISINTFLCSSKWSMWLTFLQEFFLFYFFTTACMHNSVKRIIQT